MAAVFLPVTFIGGPTGVFFKQFGVTLMTAIVISAFNALTLSPALCAVFLKPHGEEEKNKTILQRFYGGFNRGFNATVNKYASAVHFLFKFKWVTPLIIVLAGVGIWWTSENVSTGFVPDEDRGIVFTNIELPIGASLDRTVKINQQLRKKLETIPGVQDVSLVAGYSMLNGQGSNHGLGFIKLDDFKDRQEEDKSVDAITKKLFGAAAQIPGAKIIFFAPPSVPGYSSSGGFDVNLLDKSGGSFKDLDIQNQKFLDALNQRPEIQYAQSSFSTNYPRYQLDINVPLAKESGVDINSIFRTLQGYIGSMYTADFSRFGKQYRVYIQAPPDVRVNPKDLDNMFVRTKNGKMTPITQFISLKKSYGPQSVTRFNMFNSTKITGAVNEGYSTGDAINAIQEVASEFPASFSVDYSGLTREEVKASGQTFIIFILVVVFVYFLLAAQYESYLLPFSILFSVPLGIFGAYISTYALGLENNIYFQIAMIMLIGLLAKNAILIVEFAVQRRRAGESIFQSALDGAKVRLRPILMTSFAFIFGLLPLALANGVGAVGNRAIGSSAVGGMLIGTLTGVFVIPILYIFFEWIQEMITGPPKQVSPRIENANNSEEK